MTDVPDAAVEAVRQARVLSHDVLIRRVLAAAHAAGTIEWRPSACPWCQHDVQARLAEATRLLADTTDELDRWGHGDFHYGSQPQEPRVVERVARNRAFLEQVTNDEYEHLEALADLRADVEQWDVTPVQRAVVLALLDERRALIEKNREYEALLRERERLYPSEVRGWTRRVRAALAQSPRGDE